MPLRHLLPLAVAAVLAAGCGSSGGDPDADPAAITPERAPVYVEADLKPEGEQQDAVKALSQKLSGTDQPGAELKKAIERKLREDDEDFSFEEDIEPWLGDRIALFASDVTVSGRESGGQVAVVAPTRDADKARETLEAELGEADKGERAPRVVERTHRDVEYKAETNEDTAVAIVEDFAVIGNERAVKAAIDAAEGSALADADRYKKARDQVADDGLGIVYVATRQLISSLGPQGAVLRPLLGQAGDTIAMALDADPDAIRVETAATGVEEPAAKGDPGRLLGELAGQAWLAGASADLGGQLERSLRQFGQLGALGGTDVEQILDRIEQQTGIDVRRDLLAWMGDAGVFVQGDDPSKLAGALVVRSKDADKTREVIPRLARALSRMVPGLSVGRLSAGGVDVDEGRTLRLAALPLPVHMALAGDRFVLAVTDAGLEAAVNPGRPLSADPAFREATGKLGDGIPPSLFVDLDPVRQLVDSSGAAEGRKAERARRALDRLTALAAGSKRDGDVQRGRFVVGVK